MVALSVCGVCVCVCVFFPPHRSYNNFNKIREIIQNACYFLFSTVLSKIFYIKYVYI